MIIVKGRLSGNNIFKIMGRLFIISFLIFVQLTGYGQRPAYSARKLFKRGTEMIKYENYRQAISDLSEAIRIDPDFIEAYENRGVARYYSGDFTGAIEDFDKALELNPYDFETYGRRGWAKFSIRDFKSAVADFDKALLGVKDEAKYYQIRGQTKHQLRDFNGAIADFETITKSLYSLKAEKSKAYYWMGLIKIETGQLESGCKDLLEARKLGLEEADLVINANCVEK